MRNAFQAGPRGVANIGGKLRFADLAVAVLVVLLHQGREVGQRSALIVLAEHVPGAHIDDVVGDSGRARARGIFGKRPAPLSVRHLIRLNHSGAVQHQLIVPDHRSRIAFDAAADNGIRLPPDLFAAAPVDRQQVTSLHRVVIQNQQIARQNRRGSAAVVRLRHGEGQSPLRFAGMIENHDPIGRKISVDAIGIDGRRRSRRIADHVGLFDLSRRRGVFPEDRTCFGGETDQLQLLRFRLERGQENAIAPHRRR